MVALNFNARTIEPNKALEAMPSGNYPVLITRTENKPTKNGMGMYLEIEMTVQGGEHGGRKLFDRLNLQNQNEKAVEIAYRTLSSICHVTGILDLQDTHQLHGRPFQVVVIKKARDDDATRYTNEVRGYKNLDGTDPGFAGQVAQPQAQPQWAAQAPQPAPVQQYAPQPPANPIPSAPPAHVAPPAASAPAPAPLPSNGAAPDPKAPPPWVVNAGQAA